jgi:molybdenum-dependent DNA-binding transcriptional regulator ModE
MWLNPSNECFSSSVMHAMNINRLDLNLFVVLDAIYTEGSITRAAKTLNLTQPALSHALGRLRAVFNDPLFTRQGPSDDGGHCQLNQLESNLG